jgi:hypothetical protein
MADAIADIRNDPRHDDDEQYDADAAQQAKPVHQTIAAR